MEKSILKTIGKCVIFGIIWGIVLFGVALIITNFKDYELRDVLFVEGIIFVVGGVLSSIGGNPMGLSMQGLGQNNAQYIANANLEVSKMEKDKTNNIKTTISAGLSTVSFNYWRTFGNCNKFYNIIYTQKGHSTVYFNFNI